MSPTPCTKLEYNWWVVQQYAKRDCTEGELNVQYPALACTNRGYVVSIYIYILEQKHLIKN